MKDKFKKIISVILVLVTLVSILVVPVSASSITVDSKDFFDLHPPNKFILHDSSMNAYVYNVKDALQATTRSSKKGYFISTGSGTIAHSGATIIDDIRYFTLQIPYSYSLYEGDVINIDFDAIGEYCEVLSVVLVFADGSELGFETDRTGTIAVKDSFLGLYTNTPASALQPGAYLCKRFTGSAYHISSDGSDLVGIKICQKFSPANYPNSTWLSIESMSLSFSSSTSDNLDSYAWYSLEGIYKKIYFSLVEFFSDTRDFFITLPTRIDTLKTNFVSAINGLPSKIKGFFTTLGDRIGGFFGGIGESIGNYFKDTYLGQVLEITGAMKDFLNINDDSIFQNPNIPGYFNYEYWHCVGD